MHDRMHDEKNRDHHPSRVAHTVSWIVAKPKDSEEKWHMEGNEQRGCALVGQVPKDKEESPFRMSDGVEFVRKQAGET